MSGGTGLLGQELKKLDESIITPTRKEMDITKYETLINQIKKHEPKIFLHLAAFTDNRKLQNDPENAIYTNIIGTANATLACIKTNIKLVYVSTDYVYSGKKGNYKENDELNPVNKYAWSKLGGECSVMQYRNSLIIRTSFGSNEFPYDEAFVDMWTSKDTVNKIAPMILTATMSNITGILNIGTERKNMFMFASKLKPNVKKSTRNQFNDMTEFDTSLDTTKFQSIFSITKNQ